MFVLLSLIVFCLRCVFAPLFGMNRPMVPARRAQFAIVKMACTDQHPLAPIHAPTPRLTM